MVSSAFESFETSTSQNHRITVWQDQYNISSAVFTRDRNRTLTPAQIVKLVLPHSRVRDSPRWPELAARHFEELLAPLGERGNTFWLSWEDRKWDSTRALGICCFSRMTLVPPLRLCYVFIISFLFFFTRSAVSSGLSRSAGSASSAFETYNPRPSNALQPRCKTTWYCSFSLTVLTRFCPVLYDQWQRMQQCVLFTHIYALFFLPKTSRTGTRCPLQFCYITPPHHILLFIQGAKEASQRDSSRGPSLSQRPLTKLSSLDQTVQYRYNAQQLFCLLFLNQLKHILQLQRQQSEVTILTWATKRVTLREVLRLWVNASLRNSQTCQTVSPLSVSVRIEEHVCEAPDCWSFRNYFVFFCYPFSKSQN